MARCFSAKKSKAGKEIKCGRCGAAVTPGDPYFYFSVGFRGVKQIRCKDHHPRPSELCGNKMSGAYAANESLEEAINSASTVSEISSALETAAEEIKQVRDEYQDSYDNLPENFQNSDQGQDIQSNVDGLTDYADALENAQSEVESLDDEDEKQNEDTPLQQARDIAEAALQEFSF